jgi:hypothetical protein
VVDVRAPGIRDAQVMQKRGRAVSKRGAEDASDLLLTDTSRTGASLATRPQEA